MNVKRSLTVTPVDLHHSTIGYARMLGTKVAELISMLERAGGEGDATLVFCKVGGGYKIHGSMWKPEREGD